MCRMPHAATPPAARSPFVCAAAYGIDNDLKLYYILILLILVKKEH